MQMIDLVRETTATTGTGNITLAGAVTGYQTFNTAFSTNKWFWYGIRLGTEWEVGLGYLSASTTLVRYKVLGSSNSNALVNFSAGIKEAYATLPAFYGGRLQTPGKVLAQSGAGCTVTMT